MLLQNTSTKQKTCVLWQAKTSITSDKKFQNNSARKNEKLHAETFGVSNLKLFNHKNDVKPHKDHLINTGLGQML